MNYQEIKKSVFDGMSQAHKKLNNYGKEVNRLVAYTEHLERAFDYVCQLIAKRDKRDISQIICNEECSHYQKCSCDDLGECQLNEVEEKCEWKKAIWKNTN